MTNVEVETSQKAVKRMHLPTVDRSIRDENVNALLRRWKLACSDSIDDPRVMNRWFPAQRELFSLLSVLSESQVHQLGDCGVPLFSLRLPSVANEAIFASSTPVTGFEAECHEEAFMALVTRLDGLRTSFTQAATLFDLTSGQANMISRHSPRELHSLAGDPAVLLIPAAADEYFIHAGMSEMTARERTVLAATTRRVRNNAA